MVFDYTKFAELYKLFNDDPDHVAVLGAGTYSIPKYYYYETDAIIAATAEAERADLKTLNVKHYPMIKGLKPAYRKS